MDFPPCFTADIETVGIRKTSGILSIGIVPFDPEIDTSFEELVANGFEIKFDLEAQFKAGCTYDESTMKWWSEQNEAAQRVLEPSDQDFHPLQFFEVIDEHWSLPAMNQARWFFRGPHFDAAMVEHMFGCFNLSTPWKYYKVRDIRTWLECNGLPDNLKLEAPEGFIPHDAVHDAAFDAWMLLQIVHGHELHVKGHNRSAA